MSLDSEQFEQQHVITHNIATLAHAANLLASVNSQTALGTDTLKGLLGAIDQQVGLLESTQTTKQ